MMSWSTETLAWWKNILNITVIVVPFVAAVVTAALMYFRHSVEGELDRRRAADEKALHNQVAVSKQDAETARKEAERLKERLSTREVPNDKRAASHRQ